MNPAIASAILAQIIEVTGIDADRCAVQSIGGGCINQAFQLTSGNSKFFVKLNQADRLIMFEQEAIGLNQLASSGTLRTPGVVCAGAIGDTAYLTLEFIQFNSNGNADDAGRQLALLHQTKSPHFGNTADNFIGSSHQINHLCDSWIHFWKEYRLGYQLSLAEKNGYCGQLQSQGHLLLERLPSLLNHNPAPSLLHGDLWSGNLSYTATGQPVIFDPAVYYGDRETDLAMTELFGGFPARFYDAYHEAWPLDPGYKIRRTLYNLYHVLNHLNLFGGGYKSQAINMIDQLLAEAE